MLKVLIDGYNLLHQFEAEQQGGEEAFLSLVASYRRERRLDIKVVFDAHHGGRLAERETRQAGLKITYSGAGQSADELIIKLTRELGGDCVVATSDRELRNRVEAIGASTISSRDILFRMEEVVFKGGGEDEDDQSRYQQAQKGRKRSKEESKRARRLEKL